MPVHETPRGSDEPSLLSYACPEDTRRMPARPGGNYCDRCRKVVKNLSELEIGEAAEIVRAGKPGTCISYSVVEDGRVAFRRNGGRVALTLVAFLSACAPREGSSGANARPDPAANELIQKGEGEVMTEEPLSEGANEAPVPPSFEAVHPTVTLKAPRSEPPKDRWPTADSTGEAPQVEPPRHEPVRPLAGKPAIRPHGPPPAPTRGVMRIDR